MRRSRGFTLVELLVVIGIIAVLIALLMPALIGAKKNAQQIACASNMRQIGLACLAYCAENGGVLPIPIEGYEDSSRQSTAVRPYQAVFMVTAGTADWEQGTLWPYIPGGSNIRRRLFNCPTEGTEPHQQVGPAGPSGHVYYANFSYTFSDQMILSNYDNNNPHPGCRICRVHHSEHKMMLMEFWQPGGLSSMPVTGGGWTPGAPFGITLLTNRHSGKANTLFLDNHVELLNPQLFDGSGNSITNNALDYYYMYYSDVPGP